MNNEEMDFTDARNLRLNAEEKLKGAKMKTPGAESEIDMKRLLHELQVHQIELEMQNDELRKAYDTAEAALKKYTMLYDFAPISYFTLDPDCRICELNFTAAEMLGDRRISLISSSFMLFVAAESKPVFEDFFSKLYSDKTKESCKIMLGFVKDHVRPVYLEGFVADDGQKAFLSIVDISRF